MNDFTAMVVSRLKVDGSGFGFKACTNIQKMIQKSIKKNTDGVSAARAVFRKTNPSAAQKKTPAF
jgi:hypothetical protein